MHILGGLGQNPHIAFRTGPEPNVLDYVAIPCRAVRFGLYASRDYVERIGLPEGEQYDGHRFIGGVGNNSRLPYAKWMDKHVSASALALQTIDPLCIQSAIVAGLGLGFLAEHDATRFPDLIEIHSPRDEWSTDLWIVTHGDLNRTEKVQAFLRFVYRSGV